MKKIFCFFAALCALVSLQAQTVADGSKWFDGQAVYIAHILDNGELFFDTEQNSDIVNNFSLRKLDHGPGEYMLVPSNMVDDAPFRAQYGWRVQYIRKSGMYFLAVRNRSDRIVWTLVLTPDSTDHCLEQQEFAEQQPVEEMLDAYLMNPKFFARFNKDELRILHDNLVAKAPTDIISLTNLDLIAAEMEVVDYERNALASASEDDSDYYALVHHFSALNEAIEYISMMGYPAPAIYGMWGEYERTFVVLPADEDSVVELWKAGLSEEYTAVCDGDGPILQATPGKPLCFSYMVPEGAPDFIVLCRKADGSESTWVPVFSGEDGSLMTDSDFLNGEPVG